MQEKMNLTSDQDEVRLLHSKAFLFNHIMMAIISVEDERILEINKMFIQLTGYSDSEAIGLSGTDLHIVETYDNKKIWIKIREGKSILNETLSITGKSGKIQKGKFSAEIINTDNQAFALFMFDNFVTEKEYENVREAVQFLVNHREEDRRYYEKVFQNNVNKLVLPHIAKLRDGHTDTIGLSCLDILENNLCDILSSFLTNLQMAYTNFTPQEIKVANLIRLGRKSKEIAEILGVSLGTVVTHRNNIRKKLRLVANKTNLQSYLQSLP